MRAAAHRHRAARRLLRLLLRLWPDLHGLESAGEKYKSSAQGLITLATYGVGMLAGFWFAGLITDWYAAAGAQGWRTIWLYPAVFAAVVATIFALSFKNVVIKYQQ